MVMDLQVESNGVADTNACNGTELKPEHALGKSVEVLPNSVPKKTPMKPTDAMKAHLADVKARTKSGAAHVERRPHFEAAAACRAGSSAQRLQNEDRYTLLEDVAPGVHMLGVYDGHGGDDAAIFLQQKLPGELSKQVLMSGAQEAADLAAALIKSIKWCEDKFNALNLPEEPDDDDQPEEVPEGGYTSSGACAVVALYASHSRDLVVANLGDSRAILAAPPVPPNVAAGVSLTRDQTAANPMELARITAAGAMVDANGYIQGEMTPSRAIGDVQFKGGDPDMSTSIILAEPEITCFRNVPRGAVVILASDGLWDALTTDEVRALVVLSDF